MIHLRPLLIRNKKLSGVHPIRVGIQGKEIVDILYGSEKFALHFPQAVQIKAGRCPGRRDIQQIPAQGIRPVLVKQIKGIHRVAPGFGHLAAFLVQYEIIDQYRFIRSFSGDKGGDGQQGIEPPAGLINSFADKICREQLVEILLVFKGIVLLGKGHGSAVKPAVNDILYPCHCFAAFVTDKMNIIHIGPVKINGLIDIFHSPLRQFPAGTNTGGIAAFTAPDIQRSPPIPAPGNGPVVQVLQPVSKPFFPDKGRIPVHSVVVFDQLIPEFGHLDIPAGLCVVKQRGMASPAMRIVMHHLLLPEQFAIPRKPLDDLPIRIHNEHALPGGTGIFSGIVYRLQNGQAVSPPGLIVVFPEGRRRMHNPRSVLRSNIICHRNIKGLLIGGNEGHQLLIFHIFQIFALSLVQDLVLSAQNPGGQMFFNIINRSFKPDSLIRRIRVHGQGCIGSQGPRCCGPYQEIFVGVFPLEFDIHRRGFDLLIALGHFMGSQTGAAAGAVGKDLVSFIDQPFLIKPVQNPPHRLNIVVIQCNIGMVYVNFIAHPFRHFPPKGLVFEHRLPAFLIEGGNAIFFDIPLVVQTQLLFHFDLHRQAVSIPSGLPPDLIALHGPVTADGILQCPGNHMMNPGTPIGSRRSLIENERFPVLSGLNTFVQYMNLIPILRDSFLIVADRLTG